MQLNSTKTHETSIHARLERSETAFLYFSEAQGPPAYVTGARIFKRLRSPGIDSTSLVAWQTGTITLFVLPARHAS
jgi:hypothetical protein